MNVKKKSKLVIQKSGFKILDTTQIRMQVKMVLTNKFLVFLIEIVPEHVEIIASVSEIIY